jgi:predicted ATP-grasp superfamily ATP-dependent carboligase
MSGNHHAIRHKLLHWEARINKFAYFTYETLLALFSRKKLNILFSLNNEREEDIKKSFRLLQHTISFDEFTHEKLENKDLVVPLSLNDIRRINLHPELATRNPIPIPSNESMDICDDKYLFYTTLAKKGFEKDMPRVGKDLKMPYMVKKKIAHMGMDCYVIDSEAKAEKYENEINDPDYFCQEIVQGPKEYATHLLFKNGKVVYALNVIYIFSTPTYVKGRDKFICNKLGRCPHQELFGRMLAAIDFEGLCCFNYKEIHGKPYVFEINPRFGGSLAMFFFSFLKHLEFSRKYSKSAYKEVL